MIAATLAQPAGVTREGSKAARAGAAAIRIGSVP